MSGFNEDPQFEIIMMPNEEEDDRAEDETEGEEQE